MVCVAVEDARLARDGDVPKARDIDSPLVVPHMLIRVPYARVHVLLSADRRE